MTRDIMYILCGYLCGSVLFARIAGHFLRRGDVSEKSDDKNPGVFNAFKYGGFMCGIITLAGDLFKGILPVHLYLRGLDEKDYGIALTLVMAAPVLGHILPVFYKFKGGKGVAVFFGVLLGLFPEMMLPGLILAAVFIFFSVVVRISPNYYRTIASYAAAMVLVPLFSDAPRAVIMGFLVSAVAITIKLLTSTEQKEQLEVKAAWKH